MDMVYHHAVTFSNLLSRLTLIGVTVVHSPPAPVGSVWLFGKKRASFPFSRGPIYPIKLRKEDDLIPGRMVGKILKHLGLDQNEQGQFWNILDHRPERNPGSIQA